MLKDNYIDATHNEGCPFCNPDPTREFLLESDIAFAIFDKFPVSMGHALIIPKNHCSDYFKLSFSEQTACWDMVNKLKAILDENFRPSGYNIGININASAGQTVPHVHIHLIPKSGGNLCGGNGVSVLPYAHPQLFKVFKHLIYV